MTAGIARISAAPVRRTVTAAPGDQPVSNIDLAKEPEVPKTAEEKRAMPSPDAKKLFASAFVVGADTAASCQE
jgi:hypothetical protein